MTKLNENFKYEKLLEQTGMTNVWSCYRDHAWDSGTVLTGLKYATAA